MTITYLNTDIFTTPASTIIIPVNIIGVMGKGLAKQCKEQYPAVEKAYVRDCASGLIKIGLLRLYRSHPKNILVFPTKIHFRRPSHYEFIALGMETFLSSFKEMKLTSIAIPQLGCGEGKLVWETEEGEEQSVKTMLEHYLSFAPELEVFIHIWSI